MPNRYLLLWLEAPLQSWGHDSRFGARQTLDFPTRSGVLGLVCCARGDANPDVEWLAAWRGLDMPMVAYGRKDAQGAVQRQPMARDFHMVGSGYDDADPWQSLMIPKTSDGKKAVGGGAKLTHRYYLQDMAFAVALEVPEEFEDDVAFRLQSPIWPIYLGRKNCPPTDFLFRGLHATPEIALHAAQVIADEKHLAPLFRVDEGQRPGAEHLVLRDVPVSLGPNKIYRDRLVSVFPMEGHVDG